MRKSETIRIPTRRTDSSSFKSTAIAIAYVHAGEIRALVSRRSIRLHRRVTQECHIANANKRIARHARIISGATAATENAERIRGQIGWEHEDDSVTQNAIDRRII